MLEKIVIGNEKGCKRDKLSVFFNKIEWENRAGEVSKRTARAPPVNYRLLGRFLRINRQVLHAPKPRFAQRSRKLGLRALQIASALLPITR